MLRHRIDLEVLINFLSDDIITVVGDQSNLYIDNLYDTKNTNETTLDWIIPSKLNRQEIAVKSKAKVILVDDSVSYTDELKNLRKVLIVVKNPKLCIVKVAKKYFTNNLRPEIHSSAIIDPKAIIGNNVYIGSNVVIGNCIIGNNTVIHSNVVLYDRTSIGNDTVIHAGAVICADGLGCIRNSDGTLKEFPQIGGVIIGNNVYIGANTQIASGSLSDTIIENGCKINALCFIGSNCHLKENVWITGSTMLAGSVVVEKNVTIFSRVIIREHRKIGEGATIGMGAAVLKDVPAKEIWVGNPAHKL